MSLGRCREVRVSPYRKIGMSALRKRISSRNARRSATIGLPSVAGSSSSSTDRMKAEARLCCWANPRTSLKLVTPMISTPSSSRARVSARMPTPLAFSERKSSSMTTMGNRKRMVMAAAATFGVGVSKKAAVADRQRGWTARGANSRTWTVNEADPSRLEPGGAGILAAPLGPRPPPAGRAAARGSARVSLGVHALPAPVVGAHLLHRARGAPVELARRT